MSLVVCLDCKRGIAAGRPRVTTENGYVCGDCAYYRETGKPNPRATEENPEQVRALRSAQR